MKKKNKPKFVLENPIDFDTLAKAFKECVWKWSTGKELPHIPDANEIKSIIDYLKKTASEDPGYSSCGGFTIRCVDGEFSVAIDFKLHQQLPVDTKGKFDAEF